MRELKERAEPRGPQGLPVTVVERPLTPAEQQEADLRARIAALEAWAKGKGYQPPQRP